MATNAGVREKKARYLSRVIQATRDNLRWERPNANTPLDGVYTANFEGKELNLTRFQDQGPILSVYETPKDELPIMKFRGAVGQVGQGLRDLHLAIREQFAEEDRAYRQKRRAKAEASRKEKRARKSEQLDELLSPQ